MPVTREYMDEGDLDGIQAEFSNEFVHELAQVMFDGAGKYAVAFGIPQSGPAFASSLMGTGRSAITWALWKGYITLTDKGTKSVEERLADEQQPTLDGGFPAPKGAPHAGPTGYL